MIGITNSGGISIDLSSLNITADKVLSGIKFIDKNENIGIGTMRNNGSGVHSTGSGLTDNAVFFDIPIGYYNESGRNSPWVYRSMIELAATLGIEPWKMRADVNVCGVQGNISIHNPITDLVSVGENTDGYYIRILPGAYMNVAPASGYPEIRIPYEDLAAKLTGLTPDNIRENVTICGITGRARVY